MEITSQYSSVPEVSFLPAPIGTEPEPPGKTLKFCQFKASLSSKNVFKCGIRKINQINISQLYGRGELMRELMMGSLSNTLPHK